jgi:hypothetical protein
LSDQVNALITSWSATNELEDVRRNLGYDGYELVDKYLNRADVKAALGADPTITWASCSGEVSVCVVGWLVGWIGARCGDSSVLP